jgi:thioredoxin reductase
MAPPEIKEISTQACVIGAGPAGLTAAIYLRRANLDVLVIRGKVKSALVNAKEISNYSGYKLVKGEELLAIMTSHAEGLGIAFLDDDVIAITPNGTPKMVSTKTAFITADTIVIATGKGVRKPVLENEEKFIGTGVSYCATCDGPLYKQRAACVIGIDDEAAEDVLVLKQMGCNVTWLVKDKALADLDIDATKIEEIKTSEIPVIEKCKNLSIIGEDVVTGIEYDDGETGERVQIPTDCAFILVSIPTTLLLSRAGIETTPPSNIVVDRSQRTNIDGVFACGDVCGNGFQVSIAVGEGAVAGMNAAKFIRGLKK